MRTKQKLVSIIINCYNGEKYLADTLKSILKQKYQNFEVIFIDNFSTDRSSTIFREINDKRFKYFKTKKKTKLYDARNFALKKCKGEFVTFIDTDDWWDENFLNSRKRFFNSNKQYGFCYSNCYHYFQNKNKFKVFYKDKFPSGYILEDLLKFYFIKLGSIIIKKSVILEEKFNSYYNIIGDFDFMIRISKKLKGMAFNDILVNIRIHNNNFSHNNRKMFYYEFKNWVKSQDFKDRIFNSNKLFIYKKLEYLRLIYLILRKKNLKLLFDIIRYPSILYMLKLLFIYFTPTTILRFQKKIS